MIYTSQNKPPRKPTSVSSETMTETHGYISTKNQIEKMLQMGRNLDEYRKGVYEFGAEDPIPEHHYDRTRAPNFDMADATQMARNLDAKGKQAKKLADQAKAERLAKEESEKADQAMVNNTDKEA